MCLHCQERSQKSFPKFGSSKWGQMLEKTAFSEHLFFLSLKGIQGCQKNTFAFLEIVPKKWTRSLDAAELSVSQKSSTVYT